MSFTAGSVNGTLKYVSGWTAFSPNPDYNTGNFLCFKVSTEEEGTTISAGLTPKHDPTRPDFVTDADGEFVFQIHDTAQTLLIKVEKGDESFIRRISLGGLTLEEAE